jgi:hypothetical protein
VNADNTITSLSTKGFNPLKKEIKINVVKKVSPKTEIIKE